MKFVRSIVAVALIVLLPRAASADDRAKARTAFRVGSQHYNLGEFPQALESFKEAYRNYEDPSFLFNIAQCERQLGHRREAVREYRAYLNNADSSSNRDAVKQTILQLQHEIDAEDERTRAAASSRPMSTPPPVATTSPSSASEQTPVIAARADLVAASPPPAKRTPTYKKWWVWTIVGGVVAAGAVTGIALALTRPSAPSAPTSLGTAHPSF